MRKYISALQNAGGTPISSLHYFTNLFEEVQQELLSQYWTYIAQKVKTLEQTGRGFQSSAAFYFQTENTFSRVNIDPSSPTSVAADIHITGILIHIAAESLFTSSRILT